MAKFFHVANPSRKFLPHPPAHARIPISVGIPTLAPQCLFSLDSDLGTRARSRACVVGFPHAGNKASRKSPK